MESMLKSLGPLDNIDAFKANWRLRTNVFIAQEWRTDLPKSEEGWRDPLLFESVEDIKEVLDILQRLDPDLIETRRKLALSTLDLAKLEGFNLPGATEKLTLFGGQLQSVEGFGQAQRGPWWRFWS